MERTRRILTINDDASAEDNERARLERQLQRVESIDGLVSSLKKLPSLPTSYDELTRALSDPDVHVQRIAGIIERDPVLALKVLQITNSAFFGTARRISSIADAITRLGTTMVRTLVLSTFVFDRMKPDPRVLSTEQFQAASLLVARTARRFARTDADAAFTAGLLADIGKLVLAVLMPEKLLEIVHRLAETTASPESVETEILGTSHAELGAFLLDRWNLPFSIVQAVAHHHHPSTALATNPSLLAYVHAADAIVGIELCGDPQTRLDVGFLASCGLMGELPQWTTIVRGGSR